MLCLLSVGAGTSGTSDKNSTDGLVDNHAYSVIESWSNVCRTGVDLLKVRNPWGSGEIEAGKLGRFDVGRSISINPNLIRCYTRCCR
jgi:hypothetical protein